MGTKWTDQPSALEGAEEIATIALASGRTAQVLRRPHKAWVEWYVTFGNLFGSQTVRVRDLESATRLMGAVSVVGDDDAVDLKAFHAMLIENEG